MTQLRNCDENFEKKDFHASSLLGINKKEKSMLITKQWQIY